MCCNDTRQSMGSAPLLQKERSSPIKSSLKSQADPLTEKLLEFVFSGKIKALTFYPDMSLITLGFKDGKVENFTI